MPTDTTAGTLYLRFPRIHNSRLICNLFDRGISSLSERDRIRGYRKEALTYGEAHSPMPPGHNSVAFHDIMKGKRESIFVSDSPGVLFRLD